MSWAVYPTLSIATVHRHRMNLKNEFSTIDSYRSISWLLFVLSFNTLYWVSSLGLGIYNDYTGKAAFGGIFNYSVLLALKYYDAAGKLIKTMMLGDYRKQPNGHHFAFRMEMQNGQNKRRSIITVNMFQLGSKLNEDYFSADNL